MGKSNPIIENIANPHELEKLFRQNPAVFERYFAEAWAERPDSPVLAVWYERLHFQEPPSTAGAGLFRPDFLAMGILALLAGVSTRVIMYFVEQQAIAPVNLLFGILPFMAAYFLYTNAARKRIVYGLAALFFISAVYLNLLPLAQTDSIIMVYLHFPVLAWVLLGLAYTGNDYLLGSARLAYLKFNGEFAIVYAAMAISGMLLAALTTQLFRFLGLDISEFYFENIVLFGAAALAIVAAFLVSRNFRTAKNIAPQVAKIFSPLVLATLVVYLVTVFWVGKNPFLDRDFLIACNGILLSVLAVTIYSISESRSDEQRSISDFVNIALIALALIIDGVALSSMLFRLSAYGITPNRVAVLGVNLVICIHLIRIVLAYLRFLRNKVGPAVVQEAVTKYLPVYGGWAALVTFTFPIIFP